MIKKQQKNTKKEIQRYLKETVAKMENEKQGTIGRPFKLDVKNRFLVLLIYYRLYITYALSGFLLDLDQSNV